MQTNCHTISYGTSEIAFNLTYSDRETLEIAVYPDQAVWVTAPDDASLTDIEEKVRKRARWIVKQKRYFGRFEQTKDEFEYISGETHRYLGRQYRLKVIQIENGEKETVKLKGQFLRICTRQKGNTRHTKELLDRWYRNHATKKFNERFDLCLQNLQKYDIPTPELQLYKMDKRWGSYTASGKVLLNPDLVKHPTYCIDYVIVHELCHTKYPHHDKKFYQLLNTVLPDWQKRKHKLERFS
ncbi:M48 family metallopeptidase [Aliifodinibius sp. S!AR15-10]|uniref:M48 family metallopeptidase n=1 Tax=Aliifodinibius sp. S!AR15-10 TaxID=2950437 RepID=UPI0028600D3D|nr:SprT family zinc-dependent metalloprotease [Aliifodinibius sp. S!AR15-10]MDR8394454.1 M48 family metallopeptidase [Aliifodinibius sp. S!AR15-10]